MKVTATGRRPALAAINVLEITAVGECLPRRRHHEFLRFCGGRTVSSHPNRVSIHKYLNVTNWLRPTDVLTHTAHGFFLARSGGVWV